MGRDVPFEKIVKTLHVSELLDLIVDARMVGDYETMKVVGLEMTIRHVRANCTWDEYLRMNGVLLKDSMVLND